MTRTTVQAGFDTWAGSAKPSLTHGDEKALHVASGAENAYIHTAMPAPPGSTVLSAILTVYAKGASTGTRDLNVKALVEPWKARTLNWGNRPGVSGAGVTETVGTLADKDAVQFDVTTLAQAIVSGTAKNYGWRLTTTGSDHKFYSAQSGVKNPTLLVEYVEGPGQPTKLLPAGGLVGVSQPTLQWEYLGADALASFRVQTSPTANAALPAYDSGTVSGTDPIYALGGTSFADLASDGDLTYWRVQVTDSAGQTSEWSDWVDMTRDDKGTLTLNNPAASPANYVSEPTPPILFTLTGETLTAFRVLITQAADHNQIIHDSKKLAASVGAYTLPLKDNNTRAGAPLIVTGGSYSVCVRAYDAKQRQGSMAAGDEPYVEVWRDFTMTDDAGVTSPSLSSVTQFGFTPAATVTFSRGTAPDEFVILRDGVEIATSVLPGDIFVSGTSYAYRDWTAHPRTAHTYKVKAVVNGVQSQPSSIVTFTGGTQVKDLWVIDPNTGRYFALWGADVGNWQQSEVGADYWPVGSSTGFRVTQSLGGLAGTFAGELRPQSTRTVPAMVDDLWRMKEDAPHSEDFRLVANYLNIPVRISNLTCSVSEDELPNAPLRVVSFAFAQTGEFEFEGRV